MSKKRDIYFNNSVSFIIDEYIHKKVIRDMLKDKLIDGLSFREIAEKYGYTIRHTQRLIYKYQEIVFEHYKP